MPDTASERPSTRRTNPMSEPCSNGCIAVANIRTRRDRLPTALARYHVAGSGVGATRGATAARWQAIGGQGGGHARGRGGGPDDHLPAARVPPPRRRTDGCIAVHLRGEPPLQVGEKLLAWTVAAVPRCPQVDRGPDLRRFEVVGPKRLGTPVTQQVVHVPPQRACVHRSSQRLSPARRGGNNAPPRGQQHLGGSIVLCHRESPACRRGEVMPQDAAARS